MTEGAKGGATKLCSSACPILVRMLYDRPVRELLRDAVREQSSPFLKSAIGEFFRAHYPLVKQSTVNAHIISATVNDRNRKHYADAGDLMFRTADGSLESYDRRRHGTWTKAGEPIDEVARELDVPAIRASRRRLSRVPLPDPDIEANVRKYLADYHPNARYASFDYCFNHFQGFRERDEIPRLSNEENLELSCLQLGFYLASWGMLRASTVLFRRSMRYLAPVIDAIATSPADIWRVDADAYNLEAIELILEVRNRISIAFEHDASHTLLTKVMLGVFGCVPAFDQQFTRGFKVSRLGEEELKRIASYYEANAQAIESSRVHTLDFVTGESSGRRYTRAKVIDMIFFIEGGGTPAELEQPPEEMRN